MPGSPWESGCTESFDARLRYELLDGEIVYPLNEARIVIESWRNKHTSFAASIAGLQAAGACGLCSGARRVAVCTNSNRCDGHAPAGPEDSDAPIFHLDHLVGAGQTEAPPNLIA